MDQNTKLIIANAVRTENWEDQERSNDDVRILIAEFEKRLPVEPMQPAIGTSAFEKPKE